ncbi:ATP-binding cassette domain-containing protein [Micromonospora sp. NPDC047557]|uniref:ATP-binding cassette domain-containing protein n=1 Tax=Micromonospora sp. NPDC047557 TaxID=3364250 RepID=UPI00371068FC
MGVVVVEARGLGLRTSRGWVFRGVDLAVKAGELHAIVGAPGSGRTSLLLALANRFPTSEGQLELRAAAALGQVAGVHEPDPELTVAEHISERLSLLGRRADRAGPTALRPGAAGELPAAEIADKAETESQAEAESQAEGQAEVEGQAEAEADAEVEGQAEVEDQAGGGGRGAPDRRSTGRRGFFGYGTVGGRPAGRRGSPRQGRREAVAAVIEGAGLGTDVPLDPASRGRDLTPVQRQILGLVLATLAGPGLILADDIDAGTDGADRALLWDLLGRLTDRGIAVVVTAREVEAHAPSIVHRLGPPETAVAVGAAADQDTEVN